MISFVEAVLVIPPSENIHYRLLERNYTLRVKTLIYRIGKHKSVSLRN